MLTNRKNFLTALNKVLPGIAQKEVIEHSHCFLFSDGRVGAYNDEICVSTSYDLGTTCAIPHREILNLLNKTKDEEITIEPKETELMIKGEKFRSGITLIKEIAIPTEFLNVDVKFKKLPTDFLQGLGICIFSCAKDNIFSNIHCKGNIVESCDNYRATRYKMKTKVADDLLVPATAARHLIKNAVISYGIKDGWLHFKDKEDMVFSCRLAKDRYLSLDEFMKIKGIKVTMPTVLTEIIGRSEVFSLDESGHELIDVIVVGKKVIVGSRNDQGWIKETATIKGEQAKKMKFSINPKIFTEILKITNRAILGPTSILFKAKGFDHIVLLIFDDE